MSRILTRTAALGSAAALAGAAVVGSAAPAHAAPDVMGTTLTAKAGVMFGASLATVSSYSGPRAGMSALIHWGDDTMTTAGTLAGPAGAPGVFGAHRYTAPGTYTVSVLVADASGVRAVTSTVTVG
ncbi:hypothetical protein [Motilibacter aurantiacus]|uniref:hypothetical protein n=1 Tax=Motilibacter aurantiacus TaxID=2714955 RepID=UPI00140C48F8|nr:hypothetical protein [Motilibacter aurantiacus]NHC46774.1 hypothetical protein [Motilibacter aurantiacus]